MRDPSSCNFVFYWVVFLEGRTAYVQNGVIFLNELPGHFDPERVNSYVSDRAEVNEEGEAISQWKVDRTSIVNFFNSL